MRDAQLSDKIIDLHRKNRSVYGLRKLWKAAIRDDIDVGRDHLGRLMSSLGLKGVVRGRTKRTTIVDPQADRPADLVDRQFQAVEPNRLWVADITYVPTWSGFCYVAFVTDVFSRMIVGWQVSTTLRAELALDALEQAIWRRGREVSGLVHHSDRGSQYLSIRYSERLAVEGAVTSVGSRGDSFDNAMAESVNGLYKSECVWREGPWRGRADLEIATASWVSWFLYAGDPPPVPATRRASLKWRSPLQLCDSSKTVTQAPSSGSVIRSSTRTSSSLEPVLA